MTKSAMNPKVNFFFEKEKKWQEEYEKLRTIILECVVRGKTGGLTEELKWGVPCYKLPSANNKKKNNIVLIHGFKEYCALLFFKGALMKDTHGLLIQQTENVQSARQIRFTSVKEIVKLKKILKEYIQEAIEIEKAGLKVDYKKTIGYKMPEEFKQKLDEMPALKSAFKALTPGRQRGYILYFSSAKQSQTRISRIEKYKQQILNGKGLDD
jgi:uncharacterized protein YdeI (YjbR/CyaY-like superfamily)